MFRMSLGTRSDRQGPLGPLGPSAVHNNFDWVLDLDVTNPVGSVGISLHIRLGPGHVSTDSIGSSGV